MDVLTRFFTVYFDEDTEMTHKLDNAANILTITLIGTHEQIAGFLCLFFARYAAWDNWDDLGDQEAENSDKIRNQDLIREFRDTHWQYDEYPDVIVALNQRYVVNSGVFDWHVEFTTSDIAQFVSGMNEVPTLEGQNMDHDALTEYDIDWKNKLCYCDLSRDDHKDYYLGSEIDIDVTLATVDTNGIKPLLTRFEVKRTSEEDDNIPYLYFQHDSVGSLNVL